MTIEPSNNPTIPPAATKLLLWDIDGTLIWSGKAGEVALVDAMRQLHGIETSLHDVDYKGRTDRRIARISHIQRWFDRHLK